MVATRPPQSLKNPYAHLKLPDISIERSRIPHCCGSDRFLESLSVLRDGAGQPY